MKLMRYNHNSEPTSLARLGVMVEGEMVGDLRAAYARCLVEKGDTQGRQVAALRMPPHLVSYLQIGPAARDAVAEAKEFLDKLASDSSTTGLDGESLLIPLPEARLHATCKPTKVIAVGRNYSEHLKEAGLDLDHKVPSAWIKANSTIVGPYRDIVKPDATQKLDYETELALVIGKKCKDVPEDKAYDVIAGYTVFNDISARDVVRIERNEGNQLLGKMFNTFAPMGPWLVTKDEIEDPMNLRLMTRVNGETRQDGNTKDMIWTIPQLIAYLSQMTLEPGDVIATGTPEGTANGHKEGDWFLKEGDVLESEMERVGCLRNKIVNEPAHEKSWTW